MATTILPEFGDKPPVKTAEELRDQAFEWLQEWQGDCDKAGDVEDAVYYQGGVDALGALLIFLTGWEPAGEEVQP